MIYVYKFMFTSLCPYFSTFISIPCSIFFLFFKYIYLFSTYFIVFLDYKIY